MRRTVLVGVAAGAALGVAARRRQALGSAWTTPRGPVGWVGSRVIPMATASVYPVVARLLDLRPDDELLEVACGSGAFLAEHATQVRQVAGIDVSDIQLRLARRRLADRIASGTAQIVHGDGDGMRRTIITGTVVREQSLLECSDCGAPAQTPAHRDFVRGRLPDHLAAHLGRELCPACARRRADRPAVTAPGRLR